jgi:putative AlgH/UPF0301 family transcriptional regulator
MSPFNSHGTISQQSNQERNIARTRIAEAIAKEARRTGILVDLMVDLVGENRLNTLSVDQIWITLQKDAELEAIRVKADANVADFPGFSGWLHGQRLNIETAERMRLAASMNEKIYQHRFANTVGFRPAFA